MDRRTRQYQVTVTPVLDDSQLPGQAYEPWYQPFTDPQVNFTARIKAAAMAAALAGAIIAPPIFTGTGSFFETGWNGPTFTKTVLAQASFCPVQVAAAVSVDEWFNPLSEPSVKAKLRTSEYPAFTYGPTPIVNNVDQWWSNFSTPPKAAPRTVEYPSFAYGAAPIVNTPDQWWRQLAIPPKGKARTIDFPAYFAASSLEVVTIDKWWLPLETPPKAKPRAAEYPAFTFATYSPIVQTVDRWLIPLETPPKAKPRAAEYQAFFFTSGQLETVTVDKWFRELEQPVRQKIGLSAPLQSSLAFVKADPFPETVSIDRWLQPLSEPVRIRRAAEYPVTTYGPKPIIPPLDSWWRNLGVPQRIKPKTADYTGFFGPPPVVPPATGTGFFIETGWDGPTFTKTVQSQTTTKSLIPIVSTLDRWGQPLSEPVRIKPRTADYTVISFVRVVIPEIVNVDKWYAPLSEPNVKSKLRTAEYSAITYGFIPIIAPLPFDVTSAQRFDYTLIYQALAFPVRFTTEISTPDKWFIPLSEPVRRKVGLSAHQQQALAFGTYLPIVSTLDRWGQPWSEPSVKAKSRTAEYPAFVYGPTPIVVPVDGWWANLATPPKARAKATEAPFLAFVGPSEIITVDKWFSPLTERNVKSLLRSAEYQAFIWSPIQPQAKDLIAWWRNFDTPPKAKPRAPEYQAFVFGQVPIIPTVASWWQPWTQQPPPKRGLIVAHQQSLLYTTFIPVVTRQPFTKGYIIV